MKYPSFFLVRKFFRVIYYKDSIIFFILYDKNDFENSR